LPVADSLAALTAAGHDGRLVWEYEARWHPEAAPPPAGRAWLDTHR
jgi:hypothetical protein